MAKQNATKNVKTQKMQETKRKELNSMEPNNKLGNEKKKTQRNGIYLRLDTCRRSKK